MMLMFTRNSIFYKKLLCKNKGAFFLAPFFLYFLFYFSFFFLINLIACSSAFAQTNPVVYQWVTLGPNNQEIIRVLTHNSQCPVIQTDKNKITMKIRAPATNNFPLNLCEAILPMNTAVAEINSEKLPLVKSDIKRIVIIGDTGCRIKNGVKPQACNNLKHWPFPEVALSAAKFKPDLVIHVGDYLYRESACPFYDKHCQNSPHGDNWPTWQADFFAPAKPLLDRAPFIFARGNHETCNRAGEGWMRLLNPFPVQKCSDFSPLYSVSINNLFFYIIDSANASDYTNSPETNKLYEEQLEQISENKSPAIWVITHKPFWYVYDNDPLHAVYQNNFLNTLQTAWMNVEPKNINLLISGHLHRFQTINFNNANSNNFRSPQVIVGASGTRLDKNLNQTNLKNFNIAGEPISEGISLSQFGFMTMEKQKDNTWLAQIRHPSGKILANCVFKQAIFSCQSVM